MAEYGLDRQCVRPIVESLMTNKDMWVKVGSVSSTSNFVAHLNAVYDGF